MPQDEPFKVSGREDASPAWANQAGFEARFDWGRGGVQRLAAHVSALAIVDVLRFTTAVETGVSAGLVIYPYGFRDDSAETFAQAHSAILAGRGVNGPSLSPQSLLSLPAGSSVVLPSPNGANCSLLAIKECSRVVAGCLRNACAIASWLMTIQPPVGVIACGELWTDGTLRPSVEDLVGAGAILASLSLTRSPEAESAVAAFQGALDRLETTLLDSASGRELAQRSQTEDILWCSRLDISKAVPRLIGGAFRQDIV